MSEKILNIVLCAIVEGGKILLLRRNKPPYKGYLALPGGKVEFGETVEVAALREAREETGLEFARCELRGCATEIISTGGQAEAHFVMFPLLLEPVGGELAHGYEGELCWVGLDSVMGNAEIIPTDIDLIGRYIIDNCPDIFHYSVFRDGDTFTLESVGLAQEV